MDYLEGFWIERESTPTGIRLTQPRGSYMKRWQILIATLLVALSTFIIATPVAPMSSVYRIELNGFAPYYSPVTGTTYAHQPVEWVNETASPHTITHDGCLTDTPCAFDSGPLAANARFGMYNLKPGIYPYHCRLHPIMKGTLIILNPTKEPSIS